MHREGIHHAANNAIERGDVKHSPLEYGVLKIQPWSCPVLVDG